MSSFIPSQSGHITFSRPPKSVMVPKIMLLDMNSFFASVEQQANPFFRNRPVGIVASNHPTSCVIAVSKEGKRLGIKTGTLIRYAKQICPEIILLKQDPEKYRSVSAAFSRILYDYSDQIERYSIDECFVDFRGSKQNPIEVGAIVKQRIKDEVGEWLTCNVGIGDNKFLAKLASELKKPDGLSVVWREHLAEVYKGMKFSDLWGIAGGWTRRLAALNISSPVQLLNYPVQNLISAYGKPGFYIWRRVNGLEDDDIISQEVGTGPKHTEETPKSFGHSWVLNFRTTDKTRLQPVILRLAEKAARRMRAQGLCAHGIYFYLSCANGESFHQLKKLHSFIESGQELYDQALWIWKHWKIVSEVSHIAVGFTNIQERVNQLSLFSNNDYELTKMMDKINNKYGEFAIRSGLLTNTANYAPDAIAFGKWSASQEADHPEIDLNGRYSGSERAGWEEVILKSTSMVDIQDLSKCYTLITQRVVQTQQFSKKLLIKSMIALWESTIVGKSGLGQNEITPLIHFFATRGCCQEVKRKGEWGIKNLISSLRESGLSKNQLIRVLQPSSTL